MKIIGLLILTFASVVSAQNTITKTDYGYIAGGTVLVKTDSGYNVTTRSGETRTITKTDYGYYVTPRVDSTYVRPFFDGKHARKGKASTKGHYRHSPVQD